MKTIFDPLRECAGNGDMPTLDAEDAQRIVETYYELVESLETMLRWTPGNVWNRADRRRALRAVQRATESRPLQIERG